MRFRKALLSFMQAPVSEWELQLGSTPTKTSGPGELSADISRETLNRLFLLLFVLVCVCLSISLCVCVCHVAFGLSTGPSASHSGRWIWSLQTDLFGPEFQSFQRIPTKSLSLSLLSFVPIVAITYMSGTRLKTETGEREAPTFKPKFLEPSPTTHKTFKTRFQGAV